MLYFHAILSQIQKGSYINLSAGGHGATLVQCMRENKRVCVCVCTQVREIQSDVGPVVSSSGDEWSLLFYSLTYTPPSFVSLILVFSFPV